MKGLAMAARKAPTKKQIEDAKKFDTRNTDYGKPYSAAVSGAIMPLNRVSAEKRTKWGDTLPTFVPPAMAMEFERLYAELEKEMMLDNAPKVAEIAGRLIKGWDVLEKTARGAGHTPLPEDVFAVHLDNGKCVAICVNGVVEHVRRKYPEWVVYSVEDAGRLLAANASAEFLAEAFKAFPKASVARVRTGELETLLEDEIPF